MKEKQEKVYICIILLHQLAIHVHYLSINKQVKIPKVELVKGMGVLVKATSLALGLNANQQD